MSIDFSKTLKTIFLVCILHLTLYLVTFPSQCISICRNAVDLCLNSVVPSLFPFLICSGFFSATGAATVCSRYLSPLMKPLFGLPGCSAMAFTLGIVSGYPIGAVCAADLYSSGQCTKNEAERMCAFCNNSGPLFIMSVIGCNFLGNLQAGRYLYIAHILSAIILGVLLRFYKTSSAGSPQKHLPPKEVPAPKNIVAILGSVMDTSVFTMLKICGFVVFFTVFAESLPKSCFSPFLHSILEITGGIKQLSLLSMDFDSKMCIISFFAAFSGISVLLQVGAITSKYGISLVPYVTGKILQGVLSAAITKVLLVMFPIGQDTFLPKKSSVVFTTEPFELLLYSIFSIAAVLIIFFLFAFATSCMHQRNLKQIGRR